MSGAQPTLQGSRTVLRPWSLADVDALAAACQDPELSRWTRVPSPYARADAVAFVTGVAPAAWAAGGGAFAVTERGSGVLVASIAAHSVVDGVADVGYWGAAPARGRGYVSDALRTLTRWLLAERGAARVELVVEPGNTASRRVAEAAGFTAEGVLRGRLLLHGRRADVVMYALLPGDAGAPA
ncbi:GNAT family N-acetyltransferase [Motilibacter aurantiacus]|uniref:GNAT family N-acetyltransferase n=1 Tax=Motilibacter aurantiacus TaxID=2714955 RepID=UPI00140CD4D4|nr:GNAT family protein [Motilibacter aurantiacus]NHC46311.1 GNAT family N-acetyltransferase [Motilibacter aurantiacus]